MHLPVWSWIDTLCSLVVKEFVSRVGRRGAQLRRRGRKPQRSKPRQTTRLAFETLEPRPLLNGLSLFWDTDGNAANNNIETGAGLGGSGPWNTTSAYWYNPATQTNVVWTFSPEAQAVFKGTPGTVTVASGIVADSLKFDASGYAIQNGPLELKGTETIHVPAGQTATITAQLTGSGQLIKTGAGTLILAGDNDYTGGTTIEAGTLQVGNGGAAGSLSAGASIVIGVDGTLAYYRSDSESEHNISNVVSGSGDWTFSSPGGALVGRYTLSGNNSSFSGEITIDHARVYASTPLTLGTSSISVETGGQLLVGAGTYANNLKLSSMGWVESTGNFGGVQLMGTLSGDITLEGNSTVGAYTGQSGSLTGAISDGGGGFGLTKVGAGTVIFAGNNNYSGGTTIEAGTLRLTHTSAAGSGPIEIGNGTLSLFRSGATTTYANPIKSLSGTSGMLVVDGSGTNAGTGTNSTYATGPITVDGTLTVARPTGGTGNTAFSAVLAGSGTLVVANSNGGVAPSTSALGRNYFTSTSNTFNGSVQVLAGGNFLNSTFGPTYVSVDIAAGGYWTMQGAGATTTIGALTGAGSITKAAVSDTATLAVGNGNTNGTFSGVISQSLLLASGTVALTKIGTGTQVLAGANTYSGATTVSAGTLQIGNGGTTGTLGTGSVVNNASLRFNRSNSLTVVSAISGTGSVVKSGSGTLTLSTNNSYSGGTTIEAGTLRLSNVAGAGTGLIEIGNGTLSLFRSGATTTYANAIKSLTGTSGTLTVDGSGTNTSGTNSTYATGTITVDGALTVARPTGGTGNTVFSAVLAGSGTLVVANSNGGVAPSTSAVGRNYFTNTSNTFSGAVQVLNGGNFLNSKLGPTYISVDIAAGGYWTLQGGGATTTIGALNGAGNITKAIVADTAILAISNNDASGTFSGVISQSLLSAQGTVALRKIGAGMQVLSGNNSFSGGTTVESGTLRLGHTSGAGSGLIEIGDGTLSLFRNGATTTYVNAIKSLTGTSGTLTVDGSGSNAGTGTNSTYATGTITVDGTLTVARPTGGTGHTALSGVLAGGGTLVAANSNGGVAPSTSAIGRNYFTSTSNTFNGSVQVLNGGNFLNSTFGPTYVSADIAAGGYWTLQGGGATTTIGALTGAGSITKAIVADTAILAVGNNDANGNFSGTISQTLLSAAGTVAVRKIGSGTQVLSGDNTSSGETTIVGGTLHVGAGATFAGTIAEDGGVLTSDAQWYQVTIVGDGVDALGRPLIKEGETAANSTGYLSPQSLLVSAADWFADWQAVIKAEVTGYASSPYHAESFLPEAEETYFKVESVGLLSSTVTGNDLLSQVDSEGELLTTDDKVIVWEDWTDFDWDDRYWIVTATPVIVDIDVDSNNDGVIDHSDWEEAVEDAPDEPGKILYVGGDLVPVDLTFHQSVYAPGLGPEWRLRVEYSGTGQIELYDNSDGTGENLLTTSEGVTSTQWFDWSSSSVKTYWVKATNYSDVLGDTRLVAEVNVPDPFTGQPTTDADGGKVTNMLVDLDIDSNYDGNITDADEATEESRGGIVVRNHDNVYADPTQPATRKKLVLSLKGPGSVKLTKSSDNLRIFTEQNGGVEILFDDTHNVFAHTDLPKSLWIQGGANKSTRQGEETLTAQVVGSTSLPDTVKMTVLWVDVEMRGHDEDAIDGNRAGPGRSRLDGRTSDVPVHTGNEGRMAWPLGVAVDPVHAIRTQAFIELIGVISANDLDLGKILPVDWKNETPSAGQSIVDLGFIFNRTSTTRYYNDGNAEPIPLMTVGFADGHATNRPDNSFFENNDVRPDKDATQRLVIADSDGPTATLTPGINRKTTRSNFVQWVTITLRDGGTDAQAAAAAERISENVKWSTRMNITRNDKGTPGMEADDTSVFVDAPNNGVGENELIAGFHVPITLDLAGPTVTALAPATGHVADTVEITITGSNFDPAAIPALKMGASIITGTDVNRISNTTLKAKFNLTAAGDWTVRVTNPDGLSGEFNKFVVTPMP